VNKFDFIKAQINKVFNDEEWFNMERVLRQKCMQAFNVWATEKEYCLENYSSEQLQELVNEWRIDQRYRSEYLKKYKHEEENKIVQCKDCVFTAERIDKRVLFCLQYIKEKKVEDSCVSEPEDKSSECYGELFDFLEMM